MNIMFIRLTYGFIGFDKSAFFNDVIKPSKLTSVKAFFKIGGNSRNQYCNRLQLIRKTCSKTNARSISIHG